MCKQNKIKQVNRVGWIDFAKGFTILLVVFGHVLLGLFESKKFLEHNEVLLFFIQAVYWFHIPVFFALSGYFFKSIENITKLKNFVINRIVALGIPYIFYSVLHVILQSFGGGTVRNKKSFSDVISIWHTPISVAWYLYVLFAVIVVVSIISMFVKNKNMLLVLFSILYTVSLIFPSDVYIIQQIMLWSVFFVSGYFINDLKINNFILKNTKMIIILACISLVVFFTFWLKSNPEHFVSIRTPGAFGLIFLVSIPLVVVLSSIFSRKSGGYFTKYGKDSLVIYLLHSPIASVTRIALLKLGVNSVVLHIILGLLISWFGSILALEIMKRVKYLDFVFYPLKYIKVKK